MSTRGSNSTLSAFAAALAPPDPAAEPAPSRAGTGGSEEQLPPEWFREHFTTLWRIVARLGVPRHSVDDIVQEAFIAASRRRSDIREGQERRFLIGVAVRLSSNYRQRASVRREVSHTPLLEQTSSPLADPEQLLLEKNLRQQLELLLASLSDAHRAVFVLYELEGFNVPEMAELLGLPLGTVASRLGRARAKFSQSAAALQTGAIDLPEGT